MCLCDRTCSLASLLFLQAEYDEARLLVSGRDEKYVGQSCPKEAAPAQPSLEEDHPAGPQRQEQIQPGSAGLPSQPSDGLQMQELEWEGTVVFQSLNCEAVGER